jgi:hypothetical protein
MECCLWDDVVAFLKKYRNQLYSALLCPNFSRSNVVFIGESFMQDPQLTERGHSAILGRRRSGAVEQTEHAAWAEEPDWWGAGPSSAAAACWQKVAVPAKDERPESGISPTRGGH